MNNDERPGVSEVYASAITTSNLRVQAEKRGPADVLMASGMSRSYVGAALMRLRTEYGSDSVPRKSASETDHRLMMGRLKSLPAVMQALTAQAVRWRIDRPDAVALAVVSNWLDCLCRHCSGRGRDRIKDTPALGAVLCKHCKGTGRTEPTHGSAGRVLADYVSDCVNDWQSRTKRLLRHY